MKKKEKKKKTHRKKKEVLVFSSEEKEGNQSQEQVFEIDDVISMPPISDICKHSHCSKLDLIKEVYINEDSIENFFKNTWGSMRFSYKISEALQHNDLTISKRWGPSEEQCCLYTKLHYITPVEMNIPFFPGHAEVDMNQRMYYRNEKELVYENVTHTIGIPLSKYFHVAERYIITDEGNGKLKISYRSSPIWNNVLPIHMRVLKGAVEKKVLEMSNIGFDHMMKISGYPDYEAIE